MLVHTVLFWLKDNLSKVEKDIFNEEVQRLEKISSVDGFYLGSPASTTKRPVVDDGYDFSLTVILKDLAAHDLYQADSIHLEFVDRCKDYWQKVIIYDAD